MESYLWLIAVRNFVIVTLKGMPNAGQRRAVYIWLCDMHPEHLTRRWFFRIFCGIVSIDSLNFFTVAILILAQSYERSSCKILVHKSHACSVYLFLVFDRKYLWFCKWNTFIILSNLLRILFIDNKRAESRQYTFDFKRTVYTKQNNMFVTVVIIHHLRRWPSSFLYHLTHGCTKKYNSILCVVGSAACSVNSNNIDSDH